MELHLKMGFTVVLLVLWVTRYTEACKDGWKPFGNSCYKRFEGESMVSAHRAEALCVSEGGHLASIASSAENDFINNQFSTGPMLVDYRPWIGLQANQSEKVLGWTDGTLVNFSSWGNDSSVLFFGEDACGQLIHNGVEPSWVLQVCDRNSFHYVCETTGDPKITTAPSTSPDLTTKSPTTTTITSTTTEPTTTSTTVETTTADLTGQLCVRDKLCGYITRPFHVYIIYVSCTAHEHYYYYIKSVLDKMVREFPPHTEIHIIFHNNNGVSRPSDTFDIAGFLKHKLWGHKAKCGRAHLAFEVALEEFEKHDYAHDSVGLAIVLEDGYGCDDSHCIDSAKELQDRGVRMVTIPIGYHVVEGRRNTIANWPYSADDDIKQPQYSLHIDDKFDAMMKQICKKSEFDKAEQRKKT